MAGLYALSHGIEGVAFLIVAGFLQWKIRKTEYALRVTEMTRNVLALLGMFFISIYLIRVLVPGPQVPAFILLAHVFIFTSISYMWQYVTVWFYERYQKYHKFFWAMSGIALLGAVGIYTGILPVIVGKILPQVLIPFGLAIAVIGYYTAYGLGGKEGQKIALFTTAGFLALSISSILNNLFQTGIISTPLPPILNNLLFGTLFLAAVFWGRSEE